MEPVDLITEVRSGVVQISIELNGKRQDVGSGFIVAGGVMTNSHVMRSVQSPDAILVRPADLDIESCIRIPLPDLKNHIRAESGEGQHDYVVLKIDDPFLGERHAFELSDSSALRVGEKTVFLGFPFGMPQLTAHVGYVSSLHQMRDVRVIQIDGSVNGGNSGGPLLDLKTGRVAGIVTRAVKGFAQQQFDELVQALKENQRLLQQASGQYMVARPGGQPVDPIQAICASMASLEQIAMDLHRSANVGIGYAYSAEYAGRFVT